MAELSENLLAKTWKGEVRVMKGFFYISFLAIFLAISWFVRILVSRTVTRRVEERFIDNG